MSLSSSVTFTAKILADIIPRCRHRTHALLFIFPCPTVFICTYLQRNSHKAIDNEQEDDMEGILRAKDQFIQQVHGRFE